MSSHIRQTNIGTSSAIKVPLKNPKIKYGDIFSVSEVFVQNAKEQVEKILEKEDTGEKLFSQEVASNLLNIKWSVKDPLTKLSQTDSNQISKNPYISGFNVFVYKKNEFESSNPSIDGGLLIDSYLGLKDNNLQIVASGDSHRYLNVKVAISDVFGNKQTGTLFLKNPPPNAEITSGSKEGGVFNFYYSGSDDIQGINLYLFSGTNSYGKLENTEEFKNNFKVKSINYDSSGQIPLLPNTTSYLLAIPFDNLGEGQPVNITSGQVDPLVPSGINFRPSIQGINFRKKTGGDRTLVTVNYDWDNNPYLKLKYQIQGDGILSNPVSGYEGPILLDNGILSDSICTDSENPKEAYIDNLDTFVHATELGQIQEDYDSYGNTSAIYTSGAGSKIYNNSILYKKTLSYKDEYDQYEGGEYEYAYYDVDKDLIFFKSIEEIKSGDCNVNGSFSMAKNDPNSCEIYFRHGLKFDNIYEKSATSLNAIHEMPAVILNKSQYNKIKSFTGARGWIGLRRNNVVALSNIFEDNSAYEEFFNNLDNSSLHNNQIIKYKNESATVHKHNIGSGWAWVNSSGSHIYRMLGNSGVSPERSIMFKSIYFQEENQKIIGRYSKPHTFSRPELKFNNISFDNKILNISYDIENSTFSQNKEDLDITKIELYTGSTENFELEPENFGFTSTIYDFDDENYKELLHKNFTALIEGEELPRYYKLVTYDKMGSGYSYSVNEELGIGAFEETSASQQFKVSLDEAYNLGVNYQEIHFPIKHTSEPRINFNINYSGVDQSPAFINGMIAGEISQEKFRISLSSVPSTEGYYLNISSSSDVINDDD